MTGKAKFRSEAFGLHGQLLGVVASILLLEFMLLGGLSWLLYQSEEDSKRIDHVRSMISTTNILIEEMYTFMTTGSHYVVQHDNLSLEKAKTAANSARAHIAWLEEQAKGNEVEMRALSELKYKMGKTLKLAHEALDIAQNGDPGLAFARISDRLVDLRHAAEQANAEMKKFSDVELKIESERIDATHTPKRLMKILIITGFIANMFLALGLSYFLSKKIVYRLNTIVRNTENLAKGLPLLPMARGNDEIAQLDEVFHSMAHQLGSERELLQASEARVRNIIEKMPVGLLIVNTEGIVEFANGQILTMLGFDTGEMVGQPVWQAIKSANQAQGKALLLRLLKERSNKAFEMPVLKKSGSELQVEVSTAALATSGGEGRQLAILHDVSERYEVQKMRQSFVAMVSHDLRAPLTSVGGFLELIDLGVYGTMPAELSSGAKDASKSVSSLIKLVNELLDLEKMESGGLALQRAQVSVGEILDKSARAVKVLAEKKKIAISVIDETSGPAYVDSARLSQVIINFLSNAVKFSPEGSPISLRAIENAECHRVEIEDRGPGVSKEFHEKIFERFQQVGTSVDERSEGFGLGLALCKTIVHQHGGRLGVYSDLGKGSLFWFEIPKLNRDDTSG